MLLPEIDVSLGAPGAPHQPVKQAFEQRGLQISHQLITRMRAGSTRADRTAYRLACAERLQSNDATLKTEYCLRVCAVGCEHRQPSRERPRIYACIGLTRAMEASLECTHLELSNVLRTMRADLAVWAFSTQDRPLTNQFRKAASLYLRVHRPHNWRVLHGVNDLVNAAWATHTIRGFYMALSMIAGSLSRAAWLPYELDVFRSFYSRQRDGGYPLTPLDRRVLKASTDLTPAAADLARDVRAQVGVDYDESCITTHRHLLVTGSSKPVRPGAKAMIQGVPTVTLAPATKGPKRFRGAQKPLLDRALGRDSRQSSNLPAGGLEPDRSLDRALIGLGDLYAQMLLLRHRSSLTDHAKLDAMKAITDLIDDDLPILPRHRAAARPRVRGRSQRAR
ncbi:MAG: hypothetical protein HW416_1593 [Chloroflexi bacterium]|nr:hypothetical protein [Chloroflexota bacterium]